MSQSVSYTTYGRKLPRSTAAVRIEPKAAPWLVRHLNRLSRSCSKHSIRFSVSVIISARPSPCSTTTQRIPTLSSLPPVLRRRLRDARAHASVGPGLRPPDWFRFFAPTALRNTSTAAALTAAALGSSRGEGARGLFGELLRK